MLLLVAPFHVHKPANSMIFTYRRDAMKSLTSILGTVLPVRQSFFDSLSALDSLELQGSLLIDFSIIASIPANLISEASFGDISVSVIVNRFEATASFGSSAFSLDLPITLPVSGETIDFGLTDSTFVMDLFVRNSNPVDILELFSDNQDSASLNLDYGGTLDAYLPLTVGIAGVNMGVELTITDQNLFEPNPVVDYAIDLCDVTASMMDLFEQLKIQIVSVIEAPFGDLAVTVNIDKITDPLVQRVDSALANFTSDMNVALSSEDCGRRLAEVSTLSSSPSLSSIPSYSPSSSPSQDQRTLVQKIKDAIASVNEALDDAGIVLSAEVTPYFDSTTLSAGVSVSLSATIEQTASDVLELVSDYVASSTNSSEGSTNSSSVSKMGLGSSGDAPVIDMDALLSSTALAAGLDVTFGVELRLTEIQNVIFNGSPLDTALKKGIALRVDTWGAFAEMIVDPIELDITLFGRSITIRDSHFAVAAELRSRGEFVATIDDMITGGSALNTSALVPELNIPLSTEFVFDIPATDQIVVSPIIAVESEDLVSDGLSFDFDLDITTFLNNDYVGTNTLTAVLQNATEFLQQITNLQPAFNAVGSAPSSIDGFFSIVSQLNDLGDGLLTYINMVNQTQTLIAPELRPVIKHAKHLSRRGCREASDIFTNYSFTTLSNAQILPGNLTIQNFSACEYLPQLQQLLFSTDALDESVTYETFVVIDDQLGAALREQFPNEEGFDGKFVSECTSLN